MGLFVYSCPRHGEFEKILTRHVEKFPCPKCRKSAEQIISHTARPKFIGTGFHATSYQDGAYKGT
jgi:hypothetical protein